MSGRGKVDDLLSDRTTEFCQRLLGKDIIRSSGKDPSHTVLAYDPKDGWIENMYVGIDNFSHFIIISRSIYLKSLIILPDI